MYGENFHAISPDVGTRKEIIDSLIKAGLRAQLQMQSLVTGQLIINLDFYPDKPLRLLGKKLIEEKGIHLGEDVLEIPTIRTPMQKIEKTLEEVPLGDIAKSFGNSLEGIERFVC